MDNFGACGVRRGLARGKDARAEWLGPVLEMDRGALVCARVSLCVYSVSSGSLSPPCLWSGTLGSVSAVLGVVCVPFVLSVPWPPLAAW